MIFIAHKNVNPDYLQYLEDFLAIRIELKKTATVGMIKDYLCAQGLNKKGAK